MHREPKTPINVIITGATGMVGEGVLLECLEHPVIGKVLIINRKPSGFQHEKLSEIIHQDFLDVDSLKERVSGYDACFFCLGVSSVGMNEEDYYKITYTLTLNFAKLLSLANPEMTFSYISGAATDSTEKGRSMWARVKGKTENDLMKLPFGQVFAFRPGFMKATKGMKNVLSYYKYVNWIYPVGRALLPSFFLTLKELGQAMIFTALHGYEKNVLEVKDIVHAARESEK